jgi:N-acetylglucosamine transport system permease protein
MTTLTTDTGASRSAAVQPRATKPTGGDRAVATTAHVLLIIWTLIIIIPLLWVLMSSFKTTEAVLSNPLSLPTSLQWGNYAKAWETAGIGRWFINTIIVVGFALVIVMTTAANSAPKSTE